MYSPLDIDIRPALVEIEKPVVVRRPPRWWRDPMMICYGCLALLSLSVIITGIVIIVQQVQTNPYLHT